MSALLCTGGFLILSTYLVYGYGYTGEFEIKMQCVCLHCLDNAYCYSVPRVSLNHAWLQRSTRSTIYTEYSISNVPCWNPTATSKVPRVRLPALGFISPACCCWHYQTDYTVFLWSSTRIVWVWCVWMHDSGY